VRGESWARGHFQYVARTARHTPVGRDVAHEWRRQTSAYVAEPTYPGRPHLEIRGIRGQVWGRRRRTRAANGRGDRGLTSTEDCGARPRPERRMGPVLATPWALHDIVGLDRAAGDGPVDARGGRLLQAPRQTSLSRRGSRRHRGAWFPKQLETVPSPCSTGRAGRSDGRRRSAPGRLADEPVPFGCCRRGGAGLHTGRRVRKLLGDGATRRPASGGHIFAARIARALSQEPGEVARQRGHTFQRLTVGLSPNRLARSGARQSG